MSKTKTPFLSMGASGTVGGFLTSQKRGSATLLREKPIPTDPYSLAQAYQRWDYRDYAYLWTLESEASKQSYRTRGSRYHITGFSLFMREQLRTLPDLAGRWHLDEKLGAVAFDSSKHGNNGVIIGATPTRGRIDGALLYDGINDFLNLGTHPEHQNAFLGNFTLEFFWHGTPPYAGGLCFLPINNNDPYTWQLNNGSLSFLSLFAIAGAVICSTPANPAYINTDILIDFVWDGTFMRILVNGIQDAISVNLAADTHTPAGGPLFLGASWGNRMKGIADNFILYSRALDTTEMIRHSERRYPQP